MYCVSLHSCQETICISLRRDHDFLYERAFSTDRTCAGNMEDLPAFFETMLKDTHIALKDIDLLATTTGPGRFTTLRVMLSFLHGLSLALGRPLIGISAFEVVAFIRHSASVIFHGREGRIYQQDFPPNEASSPIYMVNTAPPHAHDIAHLTAADVGYMALRLWQESGPTALSLPPPMPLYLEEPQAKKV